MKLCGLEFIGWSWDHVVQVNVKRSMDQSVGLAWFFNVGVIKKSFEKQNCGVIRAPFVAKC